MDRERTLIERPDINDLAGWVEWLAQTGERDRASADVVAVAAEELGFLLAEHHAAQAAEAERRQDRLVQAHGKEVNRLSAENVRLKATARSVITLIRKVRKQSRELRDMLIKMT